MGTSAEFDRIDAEEWDRLLEEFDDASIYQSLAYGEARFGRENLSHAVIREDGRVVGLAQCTLFGVPLLGRTLAYVPFGPVWQRRGDANTVERFVAIIGALREEYAEHRHLCLRLRPWIPDPGDRLPSALAAGRFRQQARSVSCYSTCILDLSLSEDELRKAMDKRWRANLRKAEQQGLVVTREDGAQGLGVFSEIHDHMESRKSFASPVIEIYPAVFERLPAAVRPEVFVCRHRGVPVAAALVSAMGNRALYLNGASSEAALGVRGGYFLQWAIVRWLRETVARRWYDLHGTMSTPGVRQFKKGLAGPKVPEITMHEYEACESPLRRGLVAAGARLSELNRKPMQRRSGG